MTFTDFAKSVKVVFVSLLLLLLMRIFLFCSSQVVAGLRWDRGRRAAHSLSASSFRRLRHALAPCRLARGAVAKPFYEGFGFTKVSISMRGLQSRCVVVILAARYHHGA